MHFGLKVTPAAEDDLDDIVEYISRDSVHQALRFCDAINTTYRQITASPARAPVYGFASSQTRNLRKWAVAGFPKYLVFYRINADMIEIVRVLHGARDLPALFEDQ